MREHWGSQWCRYVWRSVVAVAVLQHVCGRGGGHNDCVLRARITAAAVVASSTGLLPWAEELRDTETGAELRKLAGHSHAAQSAVVEGTWHNPEVGAIAAAAVAIGVSMRKRRRRRRQRHLRGHWGGQARGQ